MCDIADTVDDGVAPDTKVAVILLTETCNSEHAGSSLDAPRRDGEFVGGGGADRWRDSAELRSNLRVTIRPSSAVGAMWARTTTARRLVGGGGRERQRTGAATLTNPHFL